MKHFRFNISLKVFALILFTVEFLAPTMLAEFTPYNNAPKKTQLVNSGPYHNPLFFEEFCENEESKEFARANAVQSMPISQEHSRLFEFDQIISIVPSSSFMQCNTHPPFFLLQHKFLI